MGSIDLKQFEEVMERAVKKVIEEVRIDDMRAMAGVIRVLVDYVKMSLQEFNRGLDEVNKRLEVHESLLEELTRSVGELNVMMSPLGRRWGCDLERAVLGSYRHALEERGIESSKVKRLVYVDVDGRYYRPGARFEIDVYIHDDEACLIEVKSHTELEVVVWLFDKGKNG